MKQPIDIILQDYYYSFHSAHVAAYYEHEMDVDLREIEDIMIIDDYETIILANPDFYQHDEWVNPY